MQYLIRNVCSDDLNAIMQVIDSTELFPSVLIEKMIFPYLNGKEQAELWMTAEHQGNPVAVAYCAPERMTEGTFNLLLIAVHASYQGKGIGGKLMQYLEESLRRSNGRILLVETSGLPEFSLTRAFYEKYGYVVEATIRDFYRAGENKVVFWKQL